MTIHARMQRSHTSFITPFPCLHRHPQPQPPPTYHICLPLPLRPSSSSPTSLHVPRGALSRALAAPAPAGLGGVRGCLRPKFAAMRSGIQVLPNCHSALILQCFHLLCLWPDFIRLNTARNQSVSRSVGQSAGQSVSQFLTCVLVFVPRRNLTKTLQYNANATGGEDDVDNEGDCDDADDDVGG
jgi:hypothetical protein